ncbi:hypothetical protein AB0H83_11255 [Dactylosporangium sp. NPDC050688]|uniref:hypothetical protein n=1 Tax=Dactylosporangium sp. NPDC050688 TaxID=3157217 RepID=UPI0033DDB506
MREQRADRRALSGVELCRTGDVDLAARISHVRDGEARSGALDNRFDGVAQSAWQEQAVVEGEVVPADEPRRVPGGFAQALEFVELRVGHGCRVLERRQRRRRQLGRVDAQPGAELRVQDCGQRRMNLRGVGSAQRGDVGADDRLFRAPGDPGRVARAEPVEGRQVRPLILVRLQRRQVQERRQPVPAAPALQRRGDQIPEAALWQHVLVREQPVVGAQVHRAAQHHGLVDQRGADEAGDGGGDRLGEEHPHVRAAPGLGDLERCRYPAGAGRLGVRECVEHRGRTVEVRHQEVA